VAEDGGPTAVGAQDGGEDAHGGGLAGPVGAEQPEHGAHRDVEVHAVDGDHVAEALAEVFHENGVVGRGGGFGHLGMVALFVEADQELS